MQTAKKLKGYRAELREALEDTFLRETLDKFAVAYRAGREAVFADVDEKGLIAEIAAAKDKSLSDMENLYARFKAEAEKRGVTVHRAATSAEANEIVCRIAEENGCKKIVKAKSMTSEETRLNTALLAKRLEVDETDLGEWIIQLRREGPTHMVLPAIHLSRAQVADVFGQATGKEQSSDIATLVKVARRELRDKFIEADLGISGANFAVAENGAIVLCTNEGNARQVTTLPRAHVALCGLDKLTPSIGDVLRVIKVLPRNATGQSITSYLTWISGATECAAGPGGKKNMHIVFLDNGRTSLAKDPVCGQALRCVRCGACANVCPVYRLVGGHKMGHIYIGAIGLILTYFFHGRDKARNLVQNCINCEACKNVCAAGIDLPGIIQEIRARLNEEEGSPIESKLLAKVLGNRGLFHTLLKMGKWAQRPVTAGTRFVRHLPEVFALGQGYRALPAIAEKSFRDRWPAMAPAVSRGGVSVGLFAGCAQDFIYPDQLDAAVNLMAGKNCKVGFPMEQSCCGLPVQMMGERAAAVKTAEMNLAAFERLNCEHIVTLCASCASHMKHSYPRLLAGKDGTAPAAVTKFASRITDLSSFLVNTLGYAEKDFTQTGERVVYHAPCHLCRGLGVTKEPRALIAAAGEYLPTAEENVCCGFGGSYTAKFPEISIALMDKKLTRLEAAGAETLVADCPGCIIQLRGGEEKRGNRLKVEHMAEFLLRHAALEQVTNEMSELRGEAARQGGGTGGTAHGKMDSGV